MNFKQYLNAIGFTLVALTTVNASKLTLRTYLEGDVEQNNSQQLVRNLPFNLTLNISNPADPTGKTLWTYNDPNFGMNGHESLINKLQTTTLTIPPLGQLAMAQLNFELEYKAGDQVSKLKGCFMGKTFKPLTDVFFHLNTTTTQQSSNIFIQGKIVPNIETEYLDYDKVVFDTGSDYSCQTFIKKKATKDFPHPLLNAFNNRTYGIRSVPNMLIVNTLVPSNVMANYGGYDFTNFPVQVTVTDGTPESNVLFQKTITMGNPDNTAYPFILDEFIPTACELQAPLPALAMQALSVNFSTFAVNSTYAYGTDLPLAQIYVSALLTSSPIAPIVPIAPVVFTNLNEGKNVGAYCLMSGNQGTNFLTITQYPPKSIEEELQKDIKARKGWFMGI